MNPDNPRTPREEMETWLTALLLGELSAGEAAAVRELIKHDPELAQLHDRLQKAIALVREAETEKKAAPAPAELKLSDERRQRLMASFKIPPLKPEHRPAASRRRFQVTLIEMLVVVGIVGILAAMLLPSLSKAKMKASSVAMRSNLHQLDVAKQLWAEDNQKSAGDEPTMADLKPYLGNQDGFASIAGETYSAGRVGEPAFAEMDAKAAKGRLGRLPADAEPTDRVRLSAEGKFSYADDRNETVSRKITPLPSASVQATIAENLAKQGLPAQKEATATFALTPEPVANSTTIVLPGVEVNGDAAGAFVTNTSGVEAKDSTKLGWVLAEGKEASQKSWAGAEAPQRLFDHQDFFDRSKAGETGKKLNELSGSVSRYDSSTFYRLQAQLGQDSAPGAGRLHVENLGTLATDFDARTPQIVGTAGSATRRAQSAFGISTNYLGVVADGAKSGQQSDWFGYEAGAKDKSGRDLESLEFRPRQLFEKRGLAGTLSTGSAGQAPAKYDRVDGDPQWLGILERPELPPTITNAMVSRYASFGTESPLDLHAGSATGLPANRAGVAANYGAYGVGGAMPAGEVNGRGTLSAGEALVPTTRLETRELAAKAPILNDAPSLGRLFRSGSNVNAGLFAANSPALQPATPPSGSPEADLFARRYGITAHGGSVAGEVPVRESIRGQSGGVTGAVAGSTTRPTEGLRRELALLGAELRNAPATVVSNGQVYELAGYDDPGGFAPQASTGSGIGQSLSAGVPQPRYRLKVSPTEDESSRPTSGKSLADLEKRRELDEAATARRTSTNAPIPQPEIQTRENNFSTFSLNISDVSFKLAAASLEKGLMPDPASVRSEEFINAFDYRDPEPTAGAPIAFAWERARYPFAHNRDLLRFSLKTAAAGRVNGRPLNIVLLLDNSGSMERADRVRIIREALRVLADQLQPTDKLSVITFARTPRLVADGASGAEAGAIAMAVSEITPQGGTNLEEAMNLAYQTALRHYLAGGINRVVLLTDGAANLGTVEPESLKRQVEAHRQQGVALDAFGIGWEGYNDDLLEVLSRNGDGRYGFINSPEEAATDFVGQLAGALKVAASDVKVQVEFNPRRVTSYRQIGYAKHQLTKEQFRDNTVDAAEIAAQEAGNALYTVAVNPAGAGPLCSVRVRYKIPGTMEYREQAWDVPYTGNAPSLEQSSPAMRLAGSAAAFSEWLVTNPFAAEVTPDRVLDVLRGVPEAFGADSRPTKLEWMIRQAKSIEGK